jgi:hypothetical protein
MGKGSILDAAYDLLVQFTKLVIEGRIAEAQELLFNAEENNPRLANALKDELELDEDGNIIRGDE